MGGFPAENGSGLGRIFPGRPIATEAVPFGRETGGKAGVGKPGTQVDIQEALVQDAFQGGFPAEYQPFFRGGGKRVVVNGEQRAEEGGDVPGLLVRDDAFQVLFGTRADQQDLLQAGADVELGLGDFADAQFAGPGFGFLFPGIQFAAGVQIGLIAFEIAF